MVAIRRKSSFNGLEGKDSSENRNKVDRGLMPHLTVLKVPSRKLGNKGQVRIEGHWPPVFSTRLALFRGKTMENTGKGNYGVPTSAPPLERSGRIGNGLIFLI
jgi:hypothetical protein